MERYFLITEISKADFANATGDVLDCNSIVCPVDNNVYVAVDDNAVWDMEIPIDSFD